MIRQGARPREYREYFEAWLARGPWPDAACENRLVGSREPRRAGGEAPLSSRSVFCRGLVGLGFLLTGLLAATPALPQTGVVELSSQRLAGQEVLLSEHWRFRAADGPGWDDPGLDDSTWQLIASPSSLGTIEGVVWFRLHLDVDEDLWGRQLALQLALRGAAELHLNGQLLYRFGRVDPLPRGARADAGSRLKTFSFSPQRHQVLAVRYINNPLQGFDWLNTQPGFELTVGDLATMFEGYTALQKSGARQQMFFVSAFLSTTLLHLLLFVFYPRFRSNLYFAATTACTAVLVGLQFERLLAEDPALLRFAFRAWGPVLFLAWIAMVRFAYSLYHRQRPKRFWLFFIVGVSLAVLTWMRPQLDAFTLFWWFHLVALGETLRVSIRAIRKQLAGAWILTVGFACFALAIAYQLLIEARVLSPPWAMAPVAYYGVGALLLAASVYLARDFARTRSDLEVQLTQVEALSAKTLEQELRAKDEELQRRLLEADNQRKTEELEAARRFQLSLLPVALPELPQLEIAVSMETATEVGGDYYDFHVAEDGTLTVVLGDATGHGARAGTMVSVMKGLFSAFATEPDISLFFHESSKAIRRMNLEGMQMAMAVARFDRHTLTYSPAGMPPLLLYRARPREVEEVLLEGMPLGGITEFPYREKRLELAAGDTVLLMSDGFPELLNAQQEPLDYTRARSLFEEVADRKADEIITHLQEAGRDWSAGQPPDDDVTFVVLKVA